MTFLGEVGSRSWEAPNPPSLAPVEQCVPIRPPEGVGHFAHATGLLDPAYEPFSHGRLARVGRLCPSARGPTDRRPWLVMILDWFPPSPFTLHDPPTGGTSVDYTVHLHRTMPALAPHEWLTGEFNSDISADGLALEHGVLRDPDGRVLAESFHTRWTGSS